jgi:hypothetical protein
VTGVNEQYAQVGVITTGSLSINGAVTSTYAPHIHTRAARTKAGWVGQVWLDDQIVWESAPTVDQMGRGRLDDVRPRSESEAYAVARDRVRAKLTKLLG